MDYSGYDGLSTLTTGHCTHSAYSDTAHPLLQLRQVSLCHRQTLRSVTSSQPPPNIAVCHVKSATAKHCCLSRQVSHRQTLLSVTSSQPPPNIAVCHVKSATARHCGLSRQVSHRQTLRSVKSSQPPPDTAVCQVSLPANTAICHVKSATVKYAGLSRQVSLSANTLPQRQTNAAGQTRTPVRRCVIATDTHSHRLADQRETEDEMTQLNSGCRTEQFDSCIALCKIVHKSAAFLCLRLHPTPSQCLSRMRAFNQGWER